ncbi:GTP pyrophosphokinase family protein [Peribacillus frigoritolerans]|uniref:GTP pyrophosphokinase n=1 Tax=Peribacillus frigoritolerans TaxID=450367 RepID=UPI00399F79D4
MPRKQKEIKLQYENIVTKYNKLGENLSQAIQMLLDEHCIQYLKVYFRIKETDSFLGKIKRKKFINPFEEIEDICGIRIICYYKSDIDKICDIISNEFNVLTSQDKEELLKPDQFGYRSHHLIVKINENWLLTPNYRGLDNLKAEIQIRTNLMHTWAEIEHEFGYKKEEDIPPEFRRRFSRLSAKLEEADEQFEELKQDINDYRKKSKSEFTLKNNKEINLDNLQAFLDDYFPDRSRSEDSTSDLVTELNKFDISIAKIIELYEKCKHLLAELEKAENEVYNEEFKWAQVGVVRTILFLTLDDYLDKNTPPEEDFDLIIKFRKKLN